MEDVTDVVFRHVVSEAARPDVFFTEFTNSGELLSPRGEPKRAWTFDFYRRRTTMVAHIWGDKPEHFRQMSRDGGTGVSGCGY